MAGGVWHINQMMWHLAGTMFLKGGFNQTQMKMKIFWMEIFYPMINTITPSPTHFSLQTHNNNYNCQSQGKFKSFKTNKMSPVQIIVQIIVIMIIIPHFRQS